LQPHLEGILVSEQALSQGAVKSFNNGLVSVNVNATAPNTNFVVFHFFGNSAHELFPRIYLRQLTPFQGPALVNFLKGFRNFGTLAAGNVENGQGVFENFCTHAAVRREAKRGLLVALHWAMRRQTLAEECSAARVGRPAKVLA